MCEIHCDINIVKDWDKDKVFVIDTETTGLTCGDVVLSLSIVNYYGEVVFDSLIKPARRRAWKEAQKIHGISYEDVKNKKKLTDYTDELSKYFCEGNLIVGYNVNFDREMIIQSGVDFDPNCEFFDVMESFARGRGEYVSALDGYKWVKLVECAKWYCYGKFQAHGSLADAKATLFCYKKLFSDERVVGYFEKWNEDCSPKF